MAGASRTGGRLACVVVLAALIPVTVAHAATVRVGHAPVRPAGARFVGSVPAPVPMHITVTLRPRDPAALAAYARAVSTPGSAGYRRYLTPARFARRFGATAAQVRAVRRSLRSRGLTPGGLSRGALSISVAATAGQLERAFSVSLSRMALPGRRTAIAADSAPAVPAAMAAAIQGVVGLNTAAAPRPLLERPAATRAGGAVSSARPHVATGGPQPCPAASAAAPGQDAFTADQIASAYGFPGLYAARDNGAGVTVAVYELESDNPSDIAAYQSCYGTHATVSYVPVDSGSGTGPGSGEAALDIENVIGLAPDVNILVYQGPNSNSGAPGSGPYDTFSAIINQDRARVVTVSWGQCESALGPTDAAAENTLFEQAAGSACGHSGGFCREVPDVSADGDPASGYLIYWNGSGSVGGEPQGWQGIGGTSGAAPLWAALLALADGSRACSGTSVGFANPALYAAAGSAYAANFNDVTSGNNDFTGTNGGRYAAGPGYDPTTGLGTPYAASLAGALCATTIKVTTPSTQHATVHNPASLRLRATDSAGARLTYAALGLPPGLKLDGATGRITGRPTRAGRYTVHASAHDAQSRTAGTTFRWIVGAEPRISRLSLSQTATGPELAFTVTAGRDAPDLRTLEITVPRALQVAPGRGVSVTSTAHTPARVRFSDHAARSTVLIIRLRKTTRSVRIQLAAPSLRARGGHVAASTLPHSRQVVTVNVVDANAGHTQLTEKVAVTAR